MTQLWQYIYEQELKAIPEEHPALITEAAFTPKSDRELVIEKFMEEF